VSQAVAGRAHWWTAAAVVAVIALGVATNLFWESQAAPSFGGFDEANHLGRIFAFAQTEMGYGGDPELDQPLHWPPTVHRLAARVWLLFGRSHWALKALWSAMYSVFCGLVWLTAREFTDRWGALFAVTIAATAPPVATYARVISLDMPLAAATMLMLWGLVRSRGLRHIGWTVVYGVAAGVACLAKGYAPAYFLLPGAAALFLGGSARDLNQRGYRNPLFNLAIGAVFGAMTMSWWYGGRLGEWVATLTGHLDTFHASGQLDGGWPLPQMIYGELGPVLLVALPAAVVLGWLRRREERRVYELVLFVLGPVILFATAPTTYARFLMPMLGGLAVLLAAGLLPPEAGRARRAGAAAAAGLAVALHLALAVWPGPAADALGMFGHPPQTDSAAIRLANEAAAHGPVVILDEGFHPYLPGGMLGYLVRLANGDVHITAADKNRDDEGKVLAAEGEVQDAGAVLVQRAFVPSGPLSLRPGFRLADTVQWSFGSRRPVLELWLAEDATGEK
jgi:Dolichyl-phosphate-mannose-protein mannosyltransferase